MKRINIFAGSSVLIVIAVIYVLSQKTVRHQTNEPGTNAVAEYKSVVPKADSLSRPKPLPATNAILSDTNDAYLLSLSVSDFYAQTRIDRNLEWKMPINFWGRVVDESSNPVANTSVHFSWNSLATESSPNGTSKAETTSDGNGFFSLTNQRGKRLYIDVGKEGYYSSADAKNATFEYAQPDARFVPDQNNPVVFHLRKKGKGAELMSKSTELTVGVGKVATLTLDAQTALRIALLTNAPMMAKQWAARVSMANGGIQPALEEFPFEAPLEGYEAGLELNLETPKPPTWMSLYQGGRFYVKTATGYGWIEIKTIPGKSFMGVNILLNQTGSRDLEPK